MCAALPGNASQRRVRCPHGDNKPFCASRPIYYVVIGSSVMKAVPKEMMGRISGFLAALMQASMPVASFICSALAVYFHIPHILVFFGSLTLICSLALYFRKKLDALS